MAKTVGSKQDASEVTPFENPLVPHRKMKQMYEGIVTSRILGDMLRRRHGLAKHSFARGTEACRVSVLLDLKSDDLTSDPSSPLQTALLRGVSLSSILAHADAAASDSKKDIFSAKLPLPSLLPSLKRSSDRIRIALGAALAIRRLHLRSVVIFFATAGELKISVWQKSLKFAAQEELPILFVVLPDGKSASGDLCAIAATAGLPGIPVDASDAVALYRVAQESIGRMRANDGPALMECIPFLLKEGKEGHKKQLDHDPVLMMGQTLLAKKICTEEWLFEITSTFEARLQAL